MGTYISIDGYIQFKTEDRPKILQALKDLNKLDDIKRGGAYTIDGVRQKWFSWMPEDYDQKVEKVEDVFFALFESVSTVKLPGGEERIEFDYQNKWGQHEPFLFAIAPYLTDMVVNHFCDELGYQDQQWRIVLDKENKTAHTLYPKVSIIYPEPSHINLCTVETYIEEMATYYK